MPSTRPTRKRSIVIAAGAVLLVAGGAHAQAVFTWTGASGQPTNYANGGNWNSGFVPEFNEIGRFLNTTANNLTSPRSISAGQLQLVNSTVSFVSANGMAYTGSGSSIALDNNSALFLRTNSAADSTIFTANVVFLGQSPFQTRSTLTLDEGFGGTVSLSAANSVFVGAGTAAMLAVQNGASLSTGALVVANIAGLIETSRVLVSGTNAQVAVTNQIVVGGNGLAELGIQNRGAVTAGQAVIGQNTNSSGTVNIFNAGSQFNVTNGLTVGINGTGTLNLFSGAVATSAFANVGVVNANGTVFVDGTGSRWSVTNGLALGSSGAAAGRLNLTGGGQASIGILTLGTSGQIDITDSTLTVGTVVSGTTGTVNFNSGTINVTNQGLQLGQTVLLPTFSNVTAGRNVNVSNNVTIPNGAELTLSGGGFTAGSLVLHGGGRLVVTDNRNITTSLVINFGSVIGPTGASRLTFAGAVSGPGSFTGNTRFDGAYTPGNGVTPVTASLDNAVFGGTNTLTLLAGFFGNQSDRLAFASLGTFGGTLHLDFVGGYTPQAGDSFDFFDGSTTGAFASHDFPDVSGLGLLYDSSQLYTTGVVSFVAVPEPAGPLRVAVVAAIVMPARRRRTTGHRMRQNLLGQPL